MKKFCSHCKKVAEFTPKLSAELKQLEFRGTLTILSHLETIRSADFTSRGISK